MILHIRIVLEIVLTYRSIHSKIMEQPGGGQAFYRRGCACNSSNTSDLPIIYTSSSQTLEVRFTAFNMTALDDPDHLNFEATYEFIKLPLLCKEVKKLSGTSGIINMADESVRK